jgi:hypothetical protein
MMGTSGAYKRGLAPGPRSGCKADSSCEAPAQNDPSTCPTKGKSHCWMSQGRAPVNEKSDGSDSFSPEGGRMHGGWKIHVPQKEVQAEACTSRC